MDAARRELGDFLRAQRERSQLSLRATAKALGLASHADVAQWESGRRLLPKRHIDGYIVHLGAAPRRIRDLWVAATNQRRAGAGSATSIANVHRGQLAAWFGGREAELGEIRTALAAGSGVHTIAGMPGVGKTQLAVAFATLHMSAYPIRWLVNAAQPASIQGQLLQLGAQLGLAADGVDAAGASELALSELRHRDDWLLIFDAADGVDTLREWLPVDSGGHVLVTSRNRNWREIGSVSELACLDDNQSRTLLVNRSGLPDPPPELVSQLGGLPLAIDQAAAVIEGANLTYSNYLTRLSDAATTTMSSGLPKLYGRTVAATLRLAVIDATKRCPSAETLLAWCSMLADSPIPDELLPPDNAEARSALAARSLIRSNVDGVQVHALVQRLTREGLPRKVRSELAERVGQQLASLTPDDNTDPRVWSSLDALAPHILAFERACDAPTLEAAAALSVLGAYFGQRGRLSDCVDLQSRAIVILEHLKITGRRVLANALYNRGAACHDLGDDKTAHQDLARAIVLMKQEPAPDEIRIAVCTDALARVTVVSDLSRALSLHEEAIGLAVAAVGNEHPATLILKSNHSETTFVSGDEPAAIRAQTDVLVVSLRAHGRAHLTTAIASTNLARFHHANPAERRRHAQEALAIRRLIGMEDTETDAELERLVAEDER